MNRGDKKLSYFFMQALSARPLQINIEPQERVLPSRLLEFHVNLHSIGQGLGAGLPLSCSSRHRSAHGLCGSLGLDRAVRLIRLLRVGSGRGPREF